MSGTDWGKRAIEIWSAPTLQGDRYEIQAMLQLGREMAAHAHVAQAKECARRMDDREAVWEGRVKALEAAHLEELKRILNP